MGMLDGIRRQLRSVIEWDGADKNTLFASWSQNGDEIKNASKLIVGPGQGAIFVYEGVIQAVHLESGMYDLETANIPFLTTIAKFMQSFESEHKVAVYFFWQTEFLNQKWGTRSPIKYEDPVYKFPVGLRSHGNFSFRITEPQKFFVNVVGDSDELPMSDVKNALVDRIGQPLADAIAEASYSYADIDKNRNELAEVLIAQINSVFEALGFALTDFRIESTDFDDETNKRIGTIADISAESMGASRAGIDYAEYQRLQALRDAAKNEGGLAGAGVGIGAGVGLGQAMGAGMVANQAPPAQPAAPTVESRLIRLKGLFEKKLITKEEYATRKSEILVDL